MSGEAPAEATGPAIVEPSPSPGGNRGVQIAAALVFAALVVVVTIVLVAGRSNAPELVKPDGTAGLAATHELLEGIPQHGLALGDPTAPVTILEFVDLQCPYCRVHQLEQQPQVIKAFVRPGTARLIVQPLAFLGPDSELGRAVYLRLAARNHGWEFLNLAFWNQGAKNTGYMTPTWLRRVTADIPGVSKGDLERPTVSSSRTDIALRRGVDEAERLKRAMMKPGDGTPFVAVGRTGAAPGEFRRVDANADGIGAAVRALQ